MSAIGLDRSNRQVLLANGEKVDYDRLLIATGTRARPWFNPRRPPEGVVHRAHVRRRREAGRRAQGATAPGAVVGSGFVVGDRLGLPRSRPSGDGCRARQGAAGRTLGGVIGDIAAQMQLDAGVNLPTGVAVRGLDGDADGHVRAARLSDGTVLEVDVVAPRWLDPRC